MDFVFSFFIPVTRDSIESLGVVGRDGRWTFVFFIPVSRDSFESLGVVGRSGRWTFVFYSCEQRFD